MNLYRIKNKVNLQGMAVVSLFLTLTSLAFLTTNPFSLIASFLIFILISCFCCISWSYGSFSESKRLLYIIFVSSFLYFTYSVFMYINYKNNGEFFLFTDQNYFFDVADSLKNLPSVVDIFINTIINKSHVENEGFYFLIGSISYISYKYFDGNSVLLQSVFVSAFSVFINVFLYRTLKFYVDDKIAFKYTLAFSVFSLVFAYAPWILRDIHILFFYTLGFYLTHKKFSFINLLLLLVLQAIVIEFRLSSGIAFTFFPVLYIYIKGRSYKYRGIPYIFSLAVIIPILLKNYSSLMDLFDKTRGRLDRYVDFTADAVASSGGLGSVVYKLPSGIKEVFIILISQLQPFPFWAGIEEANSFFEVVVIIIFGFSGIFWFYIIYVSIFSFIKNYKKIPKHLLLSLLFFCVFLYSNTSNMNIRRIMAVYPIVYIYFVYSQVYFNSKVKSHRAIEFSLIYISLLTVYAFMIL